MATVSINKLSVATVLFLSALAACTGKTVVIRPGGVPVDAVLVSGAKVGWWQQCAPASTTRAAHCRIWNGAGLILEDEEFLPYDGGLPCTAEELRIAPDPAFPGPDRIFLANGRILLPRSRFDELKIFVDWLEGKRSSPR
jgi:hypothetical protein